MAVPREFTSAPYGAVWIRCRLVGVYGAETITAGEIESEGAVTFGERVGTLTGGVGDTFRQLKEGFSVWSPWMFYGALALGAAYVWRSFKPR